MKISKKNIFNVVFLLFVFVLTLYYVFAGEDLNAIIGYLRTADVRYWIAGVIFVVLFIEGESVVIFYLMKNFGQPVLFSHCILYSFVGFFFSLITPSATGGQPMQIYFMRRDNLSISISTIVLMAVTITYKLVLVVLGVVVLAVRPAVIMHYLQPIIGWCYLGIVLNVACVGGMLILIIRPKVAKNIMVGAVSIVAGIFHLKHGEKWITKIDKGMVKYLHAADFFKKHMVFLINAFLITCVQRVLLFAVTYLTYLSFSLHQESFLTITTLQGMISVSVDMLPLPGGMGISEKLFMSAFKGMVGVNLALPLMIVSRGISFYTQLLISAVMTVVAYFKIKGNK